MKRLFLRWFFHGTLSEYEVGKRIHIEELRIYRRRWYFIVGLILTVGPVVYLVREYESWDIWLCVLSFTIGGMLTRDTIIEHYVVKILRERAETKESKMKTETNAMEPTQHGARHKNSSA
jgi:hypothetical protein